MPLLEFEISIAAAVKRLQTYALDRTLGENNEIRFQLQILWHSTGQIKLAPTTGGTATGTKQSKVVDGQIYEHTTTHIRANRMHS
jgi:hypothetical protein